MNNPKTRNIDPDSMNMNWLKQYLDKQNIFEIDVPLNCYNLAPDGYYVYALISPLNGRIFYIGKGRKNRAYSHLKFLRGDNNEGKKNEVRKIYENNQTPLVWILREGLSEKEAFDLEACIINTLYHTNLCNISLPAITDDNVYLIDFGFGKIELEDVDVETIELTKEEYVDLLINAVCHGVPVDTDRFIYRFKSDWFFLSSELHLLPGYLRKEIMSKEYRKKYKKLSIRQRFISY